MEVPARLHHAKARRPCQKQGRRPPLPPDRTHPYTISWLPPRAPGAAAPVMDNSTIVIRGAREHNLRDVNLDLPRDKLIVFTGVSGSGKSSLAFDTLYAEGQRRYVESLSSYARQFMGDVQKPDVDYLAAPSPAN